MNGDNHAPGKKVGRSPRKLAITSPIITCGPLTLDTVQMTVTRNNRVYKLTPKQTQLLTAFMRHPGQVLSRTLLVQEIWQTDYLDDTRMLDVHICWLREKIEDDPAHPVLLRTVRGHGYRFTPPEEDAKS